MSINVLSIGAGYFAQLHIDAWVRNPDVNFMGIVDKDIVKARQLAEQYHNGTPVFASIEKALEAVGPDIVDIATPPSTHADLIASADAINPKMIVCQKPFCGSIDQAKAVTKATAAPLAVHENFRFQPWYRVMARLIAGGQIGEIYQITFRLRPGDGQGPNAYLERQPYFQQMDRFLVHETAIHWIDTFRYLLGEPQSAYADLRRLNPAIKGEDAGHIILGYQSGARAVFDGNRLADHSASNPRLTMGECSLEGSEGTVTLDGEGKLMLRKAGETSCTLIPLDFPPTAFGGDCVYHFQKHITDHLIHNEPLETAAEEYLRNMEIEEAVYRSAQSAKRIAL